VEVTVTFEDQEMPDDLLRDPVWAGSRTDPHATRIRRERRLSERRQQVGVGMRQPKRDGPRLVIGLDRRREVARLRVRTRTGMRERAEISSPRWVLGG
jgi:hypothetical protein